MYYNFGASFCTSNCPHRDLYDCPSNTYYPSKMPALPPCQTCRGIIVCFTATSQDHGVRTTYVHTYFNILVLYLYVELYTHSLVMLLLLVVLTKWAWSILRISSRSSNFSFLLRLPAVTALSLFWLMLELATLTLLLLSEKVENGWDL